ncbi:hypothetical protein [Flavobacterium degerlachei]|jgi:hypothetical protein|uniref:Uncharacterized protein n=1 Tax=Flavobacterium degerlachei TaxID=229203 RepID=A0A1H2Z0L9_9FLAO|nr:hypothetical protein [Flavobacterium degerlachei]SDX10982.1 hypothetical protein SAMN05444338_10751 [Flavobacterium degerlachei]
MEIHYYEQKVARYFIIIDGVYEISTDSLDKVISYIKGRSIPDIMLLDVHERKWIDVESLLKI